MSGGSDFTALYFSALLRARQTADVVSARLSVRDDPRLVETDTGLWTDRFFGEIETQQPEAFAAHLVADPTFRLSWRRVIRGADKEGRSRLG